MVRALPILGLDVVGREGRRTTGQVVYCPRKRRSLLVEECSVCPRALSVGEGPGLGAVRCTPDVEGGDEGVGARLVSAVVSVAEDLSSSEVASLFKELRAHVLPVVDAGGHFVGVVCEADMAPHPDEPEHLWLRHFLTARALDLATPGQTVADSSSAVSVLRAMATARTRHVTVLTDEQRPLATISDLEALAWMTPKNT